MGSLILCFSLGCEINRPNPTHHEPETLSCASCWFGNLSLINMESPPGRKKNAGIENISIIIRVLEIVCVWGCEWGAVVLDLGKRLHEGTTERAVQASPLYLNTNVVYGISLDPFAIVSLHCSLLHAPPGPASSGAASAGHRSTYTTNGHVRVITVSPG